jgi:hypothetical protein
MNDDVTIKLPPYAVRYLKEMCERERKRLVKEVDGLSLQGVAAFDALNTIVECLP